MNMKTTITTFTGKVVGEESDALPSFRDIGYSMLRTPMYAGHSFENYSVLEHCLTATVLARRFMSGPNPYRIEFFVLMHELEVALYGDIPGPNKTPDQREREAKLRSRFFSHHLIPVPTAAEWERVELCDKLEQHTMSRWNTVGGRRVHEQIWDLEIVKTMFQIPTGSLRAVAERQQQVADELVSMSKMCRTQHLDLLRQGEAKLVEHFLGAVRHCLSQQSAQQLLGVN